jgi:hypothetical protein
MADDQKAPTSERAVVEVRRYRARTNLIPMVIVVAALLSAVALYALDSNPTPPVPQPNYRAEQPPATQPAPAPR